MHLLHCRETPAGPLTTGPRGAVVRSPLAPSGGLAYRRQCACRRPRRRSMAWYARHRRSSCFGIFKHVREVPHTCYLLAFSQWLVTPHVPSLRVGYCTAHWLPKIHRHGKLRSWCARNGYRYLSLDRGTVANTLLCFHPTRLECPR